MRNRNIFVAILLLLLFATVAVGEKQTTEAEVGIPLYNSTEYKSVILTFGVTWEGDMDPSYIEVMINHYFLEHPEYYSTPVDKYLENRMSIADNVSRYINETLSKEGIIVEEVYFVNFVANKRISTQELQRQYDEYRNDRCHEPIIIYKEESSSPIWYLLVLVAGVLIGHILTYDKK